MKINCNQILLLVAICASFRAQAQDSLAGGNLVLLCGALLFIGGPATLAILYRKSPPRS